MNGRNQATLRRKLQIPDETRDASFDIRFRNSKFEFRVRARARGREREKEIEVNVWKKMLNTPSSSFFFFLTLYTRSRIYGAQVQYA